MKKKWLMACCMLTCAAGQASLFSSYKQDPDTKWLMETIDWEAYYTDLSSLETDESILEQWAEHIQELVEQPLNINSASKEELIDLPLMNDVLVEAISYYLYRYGPMKDVAELKLIEGINDIRYNLLHHLVYVGPTNEKKTSFPSLHTILEQGKHDIRLQVGRTLEEKKGYSRTSEPSQQYQGDAWASTVRYGFNFKKNLQFGFTTQKDAGETWLNSNGFPDYLSAHFMIKDIHRCKAFVAGDYALTLGQGLICGQSFQLGKGSFTGSTGTAGSPIKRHASAGESAFFRGLAFDLDLFNNKTSADKPVSVSLIGFYSNQRIDGNAYGDTITSIITTGLHRTTNEVEKQKNTRMITTGGSLALTTKYVRMHANVLTWNIDKKLLPEQQPYNHFYLRGDRGSNLSLDYQLVAGKTTFFGEVAVDQQIHLALQAGCHLIPLSGLSLILHYRNHGLAYCALYARAFGEHNNSANERGLFTSFNWEVAKSLTISGYLDVYEFPWLTYNCDEPSSGHQLNIQGLLRLHQTATLLIRCSQKKNLQNQLTPERKNPFPEETIQRRWRLHYTDNVNEINMQTIFDATSTGTETGKGKKTGFALSQAIKYTCSGLPLTIHAKISCFDIPDYDNRIFSYETTLPGSARFTSLYGRGSRINMLIGYSMNTSMQWWLEASHWNYTDRTLVGTGPESIQSNHLTMIQLMLRLKLH